MEGFRGARSEPHVSNWRAEDSLHEYLKHWKIVAIEGLDTRALVRHIRDKGAMRACLSTIDLNEQSLIEKARQSPPMENRELASLGTTKERYECLGSRQGTFSRRLLRLRREEKFTARDWRNSECALPSCRLRRRLAKCSRSTLTVFSFERTRLSGSMNKEVEEIRGL